MLVIVVMIVAFFDSTNETEERKGVSETGISLAVVSDAETASTTVPKQGPSTSASVATAKLATNERKVLRIHPVFPNRSLIRF